MQWGCGLGSPDGTAILVLPNFQRFLNGAEVIQATHHIQQDKQSRSFMATFGTKGLEAIYAKLVGRLPSRAWAGLITIPLSPLEGSLQHLGF